MVLVSEFWIVDKLFNLLVCLFNDLWVEVKKESEESEEIDKSSQSKNWYVFEFLDQVSHMGYDQLGEYF